MEKVNKLAFEYRDGLMNKTNVVGVGVGYKIKDGKDTGVPSIIVLLKRKYRKRNLVRSQIIPEKLEETYN